MAGLLLLSFLSRIRRTKQSLSLVFLDLLDILAHLDGMDTICFEDCINLFQRQTELLLSAIVEHEIFATV